MNIRNNPVVGGLIGLVIVVALVIVSGLPEGAPRQQYQVPGSGEPTSVGRPSLSGPEPKIVKGPSYDSAVSKQFLPPGISPLVRTVVVPKGASCTKLFGITIEKCVEQAEKAGRMPVWYRDAAGKAVIDVPLVAGEIVYLLRNTETEEVLPHFQPEDGRPVDISVEINKEQSR